MFDCLAVSRYGELRTPMDTHSAEVAVYDIHRMQILQALNDLLQLWNHQETGLYAVCHALTNWTRFARGYACRKEEMLPFGIHSLTREVGSNGNTPMTGTMFSCLMNFQITASRRNL
jgi:hypothetical protein